jgi:hypothetical protein
VRDETSDPIIRLSISEWVWHKTIFRSRFTIDQELTSQDRRFNTEGTQLTVRLLSPFEGEDSNPMSHFLASMTELSTHYEIARILIWSELQLATNLMCRRKL